MKNLILIFSLLLPIITFAQTRIEGAGATFPFPLYSKWFAEYEKINKDIKFNYQAIGSGGGIRQLIKETVDFGASDAPMKEKEMKKLKNEVYHIPTVLGAVAVAYNLKEVKKEIKLDGETLANIFLGKITKWNNEQIKALNKGVNLPNKDILVVRRADGSGTTAIFSDYLSTVSSEFEKQMGRGKSLNWPTGVGAKGNDGVTNIIKQIDGAIGYIELAYAKKNNIPTVAIKNQHGQFEQPTIEGVSRSASTLDNFTGDLRVSIVNAKGEKVYPISAFTYILLPVVKTDKNKQIKKFLNWAITDGQEYAKPLFYAPLPKELVTSLKEKLK